MGKVELLVEYGVKVNDALEFWGDMDSYNENLKEYGDALKEKLNNLEHYKNTKDFENYGILAHSMKSESKYLGFMDDANVFLNHEMAGKEENESYITEHFQDLGETVSKINILLSKYFGESQSTSNQNILIADDSTIILNFIEKSIGSDYQVFRASNGNEAINIIENTPLYAILLDLNMPSANGFEVLNYLKEHDLIEKIPVVIITGDDTEETIKKAFTYPILDVLNKPFTEENINRVLVSIKSFHEHK